jgi:heptosyltransferase-1
MSRAQRSFLIVRLSAIGDVVMASPLIGALRARYPDSRIAWLVQPECRDLLSANPQIDEVVVWTRGRWREACRKFRWLTLLREILSLRTELRSLRVDTAIDAQGLLKSGLLTRLSGAPTRIGLGSREGSSLLMTQVVEKPSHDQHIGSEYRHLASTLGLDTSEFRMRVSLTDEDRVAAATMRSRLELSDGYAVLCPFTTRPQKHWRTERWPALAHELRVHLGLQSIVLGGPGDATQADAIAAAGGDLRSLAGSTSLREAAALIEGAELLVGVDTGLTHMGSAFRIPTVALFGSTCPYLDAGTPSTVVIYKALPCAPCKRHPTCGGAFTCMSDITVEEIVATARNLRRQIVPAP